MRTTQSERTLAIRKDDLPPGSMKTLWDGKVPVVVVCTAGGEYHAVRGLCPHQGAMLGRGKLWPLTEGSDVGEYTVTRDAEILRCPWHSFDYDVTNGLCVTDPRLRIKTYPVRAEGDELIVELRPATKNGGE